MNEQEKEIVTQLIALMAHVEGACEELGFTSPVEVCATDVNGQTWQFDFDAESDSVDLLHVAPKLPITLELRDSKGNCVTRHIAHLVSQPEWKDGFLQ
jgi:hypothetical protein